MAKLAVVDHAHNAVLGVFTRPDGKDEVAVRYRLPNGDSVSPLIVGWTSGDYAVLPVSEFVDPKGKRRVGEPSYPLINGVVTESFDVRDVAVERPMVRKSTVQDRLIAAGKLEAAYAVLTSNPIYFARWFVSDHPEVYCDDPDALALLHAIGADPNVILAAD